MDNEIRRAERDGNEEKAARLRARVATRPTITATFLFSGMGGYWSGNGERWKKTAGCLFAYYDPSTTLRQLVDAWVDDSRNGDLDDKEPWADVEDEEIRAAIVKMLSRDGQKEYADPNAGPCDLARELDPADWSGEDTDELPMAIVLVRIEKDEDE